MPTVSLFANLRNLTGVKAASIAGESVRELLENLIARFPALEGVIMQDGSLRAHYIIMVNGHNIALGQGLDTPVSSSDQVAIFPPIAGG